MKIRKEYGDKNLIGKKVYELRKKKGMKQKEFLAKIQLSGFDMNPSSLSKLEGQQRIVTDKEIIAIAKVLHMSCDDLLGFHMEEYE